VTQFGIVSFNGKGLALVPFGKVDSLTIGQVAIDGQIVAVVPIRRGGLIYQFLQPFIANGGRHRPPNDASCGTIYQRYDVGFVFFFSMKVCSSSSSIVSTSSGVGAGGSWAA
jgi:hypothetical protein